MESGQSSHSSNQPMQLMWMNNFGNNIAGEDVPDQDDQKPHVRDVIESGNANWNSQTESIHIPWWVHQQEASLNQNYVKYLDENSDFVPVATPPEPDMMLESLPLPACGVSYDVSGLSDYHTELSSCQYLGQACGSTSNELDAWNVKYNEDLGSHFSSAQHQTQNHSSWIQNSNGNSSCLNVSQVYTPNAQGSALVGSPSQPRSRASNAKSKANDRQRRIRITERLTALQELLPRSGEGCQASILDDIIDYTKYLQLQIKDLCKSKTKLEHESAAVPIIFREGYGHYFCDQQGLNEPLEEMVGKLLELNPSEAMQLLEMKGLLLMPIEFAHGLS